MEENNQALFEEEFEMPSRPLETLKRMWNSVEEQHGRLLVVFVSVIFYTLLSILAPVRLSNGHSMPILNAYVCLAS